MRKILLVLLSTVLVFSASALEVGVQGNVNKNTFVLNTHDGDTKDMNIEVSVAQVYTKPLVEKVNVNYGIIGKVGFTSLFGDMKDNVFADGNVTAGEAAKVEPGFATYMALTGSPAEKKVGTAGFTYDKIMGMTFMVGPLTGLEVVPNKNVSFGLDFIMGPRIRVYHGEATTWFKIDPQVAVTFEYAGWPVNKDWQKVKTDKSWMTTFGFATSLKPYVTVKEHFKVFGDFGVDFFSLVTRYGDKTENEKGFFKNGFASVGVAYKI